MTAKELIKENDPSAGASSEEIEGKKGSPRPGGVDVPECPLQ